MHTCSISPQYYAVRSDRYAFFAFFFFFTDRIRTHVYCVGIILVCFLPTPRSTYAWCTVFEEEPQCAYITCTRGTTSVRTAARRRWAPGTRGGQWSTSPTFCDRDPKRKSRSERPVGRLIRRK